MDTRLLELGLPEILEDPERLAQLDDEQIDLLITIRDEAAEGLEQDEDNTDLIDTVYLAHMTLSSALFLRAIATDIPTPPVPAPQVVARSWSGAALQPCSADAIADMLAPKATIDMLTKAGLPEHAEPELTFVNPPTKFINDLDLSSEEEDASASEDFFSTFWKIASTEDGDAVCIDERADCAIVLLDREWGYYAQQFVNSSVAHFILCLDAWRAFEEADNDNLDEAVTKLERALERIDPVSLTEGAYWAEIINAID